MTAIAKAALAAGLGIIQRVVTVELFKWLFFYAGEQLVKSTETKHDDKFFKKIKELYEASK